MADNYHRDVEAAAANYRAGGGVPWGVDQAQVARRLAEDGITLPGVPSASFPPANSSHGSYAPAWAAGFVVVVYFLCQSTDAELKSLFYCVLGGGAALIILLMYIYRKSIWP